MNEGELLLFNYIQTVCHLYSRLIWQQVYQLATQYAKEIRKNINTNEIRKK